jgi:uncharacterized OsmC-like protein
MDAETLKERQRPLKQRYRDDPESGRLTLKAAADLSATDVSCSVDIGRAIVEAGLHPATGGDGTFACSGDMLLQALAACAGVTLRSVATSRGLKVAGRIRAEGDLDFRGTLGVDKSARVGFETIRLSFDLESDASADDLEALISTTERYCVVLQTIVQSPTVEVARSDGASSR